MLTYSECFTVVDAGIGRWVIRHSISEELAGTLTRTPAGYLLKDSETASIGVFATRDDALLELYAAA